MKIVNLDDIRLSLKEIRRVVLWLRAVNSPGHTKIFSKSYWIRPKSDCFYPFPVDLEPNGSPFDFKSIGKWWIQSDFYLIFSCVYVNACSRSASLVVCVTTLHALGVCVCAMSHKCMLLTPCNSSVCVPIKRG